MDPAKPEAMLPHAEQPPVEHPTGSGRRRLGTLGAALLVAAAGAGIVVWAGVYSYRVWSDVPSEGMARFYLPGIRVDLPDWEISRDERGVVPGVLHLEGGEELGYASLHWCPGFETHYWDYSDHLLDANMAPQGHSVALGADAPVMLWHALDAQKHPLVTASWLCKRPYMRYFLHVSLEASWEVLIALAKRVLSSVRCDPGTIADVDVLRLPVMRRGSRCYWHSNRWGIHYSRCLGEGYFRLYRGVPGALDPETQVAIIHRGLGFYLSKPPDPAQLRTSIQQSQPKRRTVHRAQGPDEEGAPIRVLWTLFYCDEVDQTFLATYGGSPDEDEQSPTRRLEGLQCPSRLPAHLVLVEPAPPSEPSTSEDYLE